MGRVTGRRWRRSPRTCPWWCAKDHQCTVRLGYPGEHRSDPQAKALPWGRMVATRIEPLGQPGRVEVRAVARLPADEDAAGRAAVQVAGAIDAAVRRALAGAVVGPWVDHDVPELEGAR